MTVEELGRGGLQQRQFWRAQRVAGAGSIGMQTGGEGGDLADGVKAVPG